MTAPAIHAHRFVFEEQHGPTSEGRCRCGATQVRSNVFRDDQEKEWRAWASQEAVERGRETRRRNEARRADRRGRETPATASEPHE